MVRYGVVFCGYCLVWCPRCFVASVARYGTVPYRTAYGIYGMVLGLVGRGWDVWDDSVGRQGVMTVIILALVDAGIYTCRCTVS